MGGLYCYFYFQQMYKERNGANVVEGGDQVRYRDDTL